MDAKRTYIAKWNGMQGFLKFHSTQNRWAFYHKTAYSARRGGFLTYVTIDEMEITGPVTMGNERTIATLQQVLATQNMDANRIDQLCDEVLDGSFDANKDPITGIIVNTFIGNDYGTNVDSFVTDLEYAIDALRKAQTAIKR